MSALAPPTAKVILARVLVTYDPLRHRLLVAFEPGDQYRGLQQVVEDFRFEFRGHGELTWRRTTRLWSMPYTPSIVQRVRHWCDLVAADVSIEWEVH